jgi:hypothetical protein
MATTGKNLDSGKINFNFNFKEQISIDDNEISMILQQN